MAPADPSTGPVTAGPRPSRRLLAALALGCIVAVAVAFAAGDLLKGKTNADPVASQRSDRDQPPLGDSGRGDADSSDSILHQEPAGAPPTPELLTALPSEFPTSIARTARTAQREDQGGHDRFTLVVPAGTTPTEDLFALAERLRSAGWQVDPPSQQDTFAFAGFGWSGQARPAGDDTLIVELSRRR